MPRPSSGGGGKGKWIAIGVALIAVIALAVAGTVYALRPDKTSHADEKPPVTTTTAAPKPEFASAADKGPVNIIVDDPTCAAWEQASRDLADTAQSVNWVGRDSVVPVADWNDEQKAMYAKVSQAMMRAADQAEKLSKVTPHRVMRELYGQYAAYARFFNGRLPDYGAKDGDVAAGADTLAVAVSDICAAVVNRVAAQVTPPLPNPQPPSKVDGVSAAVVLARMQPSPNPICPDWETSVQKFSDDTADWVKFDPAVPAANWTAEQREIAERLLPVMSANADEVERLGRASNNPTIEDIAVLAAQYFRAFAAVAANYEPADIQLVNTASDLTKVVRLTCTAAA